MPDANLGDLHDLAKFLVIPACSDAKKSVVFGDNNSGCEANRIGVDLKAVPWVPTLMVTAINPFD
jgi:hypothetical protein